MLRFPCLSCLFKFRFRPNFCTNEPRHLILSLLFIYLNKYKKNFYWYEWLLYSKFAKSLNKHIKKECKHLNIKILKIFTNLLFNLGIVSSFFTLKFCFKIFFLMWTIFKVFIEFVTILLLFYVLVFWQRGMWDLSSPTRDQTRIPFIGRWSLNHWTTREVLFFLSIHFTGI